MPITIPHPLTIQEIRVLQEFRRVPADALTAEAIRNVKHPAGGEGGVIAKSLVEKGYLTSDGAGENYTLTDKAKKFLAIDYKPLEPPPAKTAE